jgi:hypothetical protein
MGVMPMGRSRYQENRMLRLSWHPDYARTQRIAAFASCA